MFGWIDIQFGFLDCDEDYTAIAVHPEWNMIFFAGEDGTIIAYDMDRIRVHVIPARVFWYDRRSIKKSSIADHSVFLMFPCSWNH